MSDREIVLDGVSKTFEGSSTPAVAPLDLTFAAGEVTVLIGPPEELTFDDDQCRALDALAAGGLVPPLRMVRPVPPPTIESA